MSKLDKKNYIYELIYESGCDVTTFEENVIATDGNFELFPVLLDQADTTQELIDLVNRYI